MFNRQTNDLNISRKANLWEYSLYLIKKQEAKTVSIGCDHHQLWTAQSRGASSTARADAGNRRWGWPIRLWLSASNNSSSLCGWFSLSRSFLSISPQAFSIGFMSGDLEGHDPNSSMLCCCSHVLVVLAVCGVDSSCISFILLWCPFMNGSNAVSKASSWYLVASTFPLNLINSLFPSVLIAPQTMMVRRSPAVGILTSANLSLTLLYTLMLLLTFSTR